LESRFSNLTRLSLAEYSLYSGFVVLTRAAGSVCGDECWALVPNSPPQWADFGGSRQGQDVDSYH